MFNGNLPLVEASTLPSFHYKEANKNAFKGWVFVGYKHDLKNEGDYFTFDLLNNPIVVINHENEILAFHNVCRHHASTLLADKGNCSKIRCPYHGWTYNLKGELKGTPEFQNICNFNKEDNGLIKLQVGVFDNLIFVKSEHYIKGPDGSLFYIENYLRPFGTNSNQKFVLPNYSFYKRIEYNLKCDWKVFVDNFLDGGLHVLYVHEALASAIDYKNYTTEIYENCVLQIAPLKPSENELVNKTRSGDYAYYWWFYPNLMINVYGDFMDINVVYPNEDGTCKVFIDFFHSPDFKDMELLSSSIEVAHKVQLEDIDICEKVQKGLNSDYYDIGRYSERESGMYHFHKLYSYYAL